MKTRFLEVVEMPNGDILFLGKYLCNKKEIFDEMKVERYLYDRDACCEHLDVCQEPDNKNDITEI